MLDAIEAIEGAEQLKPQDGIKLKSGTIRGLGEAMIALSRLYPFVKEFVDAIIALEDNPETEIPTGDISGSAEW